ncbi:MAG TPA: hypothetical protein PKX13_13970, partial [Acidiphilium sp.]|nr:hypothetical protein [Acidiphilium sp.]
MALSGGNNRATTLFLNTSPYRAIFHPYRPQVKDYIGATTILTRGGYQAGYDRRGFGCLPLVIILKINPKAERTEI